MSAVGFTPIQLYRSTTASAVPTSGNLADGELAINTNDGKMYYKDSGGTVQLMASKAGASGDVVGPASATDNAVVRFDGTTGKLVQNSVVTIADSTGDVAGVGALTMGGNLTLSGGTANGVLYLNGSKVATSGSALTFDGSTLIDTAADGTNNFKAKSTTGVMRLSGYISAFSGAALESVNAAESAYAPLTTVGSYFAWNTGSEQMRLTSTGLGIGTSSPGAKLDVTSGLDATYNANVLINSSVNSAKIAFNPNGVISSGIGVDATGIRFYASGANTVRATIDYSGNLGLGGSAARATTAGSAIFNIFNGTAPVGTLTNGISLYSSSGEAYVMDAAGNATLFSPHDTKTNEWIFHSKHTPSGKVLRIDVERLLKFVNDHFGLDAVQEFIEP